MSTVAYFLFNYHNFAWSSTINPIAHLFVKWIEGFVVEILLFKGLDLLLLLLSRSDSEIWPCALTDLCVWLAHIYLSLLFPWPSLSHLAQSGFYSQHFLLDAELYHRKDIQFVSWETAQTSPGLAPWSSPCPHSWTRYPVEPLLAMDAHSMWDHHTFLCVSVANLGD